MTPPVLAIGDVHGKVDCLEALLRQEGLLDRCTRCDGSGEMLSGYAPGPVDFDGPYPQNCLKCHGEGWARTDKEATVVQIGDLGHFGIDGSPTGDLLCYKYAWQGWIDIVLWGNHDRAMISKGTHDFKGFIPNYEAGAFQADLCFANRMRTAYNAHGWLLTHAGLAAAFKYQSVSDDLKEDIDLFVNWINDNDREYLQKEELAGDSNVIGIVNAVSRHRGGSSNIGGILWRDSNKEKLYTKWPQVFGHTARRNHKPMIYPYAKSDLKAYNIDIGGKPSKMEPGANCLAGIWLPEERLVRVNADIHQLRED